MKNPEPTHAPKHWLYWLAIAISIAVIAFITLSPQDSVHAYNELRILKGWNREHLREDLLNLLLFMPLGGATAAAHLRFKRWLGMAAGISLLVEFLQWTGVVHGRFAELQDVLSNVAGFVAGFGLLRALARVMRSRQPN